MEENKATIRRAVSHFSAAGLETYLQLYRADAKLHFLPPGLPQGREGARLFYRTFFDAFPDGRLTLEDFVAEGEKVACRFRVEATHRGEFMGVAATGKRVSVAGITILWFEHGQCVERWSEANYLGLLEQIGAVPAAR